jgi:hypothetical protein
LLVNSLRRASNRGGVASTFPTEFNVARQVVLVRGGRSVTFNTKGRCDLGVRYDELYFTENTARRDISLTHITELTSTRTIDGGSVLGTRDSTVVTSSTRVIRGTTTTRPGSSSESTSGGVQSIDTTRIGERGDRYEVASISGNLLKIGGNGSHLILYLHLRKYFWRSGGKEGNKINLF